MRGLILIACIALAPCAAAQQGRADIKGISPGMPRSELLLKFPGFDCATFPSDRDTEGCRVGRVNEHANMTDLGLDTYAGKRPRSVTVLLAAGRVTLISVALDTRFFGDVTGAIETRYGKAAGDKRSVAHNRMGAAFDQRIMTWLVGDTILTARQLGATVDEMDVSLSLRSAPKEDTERREEQRRKASQDL